MFDSFVKQIAKKESVTQQFKADVPILWVGRMNNIRNRVTGIVNNELIFV